MNNERKEIIQLNGLTILLGMAVIANLVIVGFFYRWHKYQVYLETKRQSDTMTLLESRKIHDVKNEIVALEGVASWNQTRYALTHEPLR